MGRYTGKSCRLSFMLGIMSVFFTAEIVGGYVGNSIALISDSFNMLSDIISLSMGLLAARVRRRNGSRRFTYGLARVEVVGALSNAVFLSALCFTIAVQALKRLIEPERIDKPKLVLIVGSVGLGINIVGLVIFQDFRMLLRKLKCQSDSSHFLTCLAVEDVCRLPCVISVHEAHMFELTKGRFVATLHVRVSPELHNSHSGVITLHRQIREVFHKVRIHSVTVQLELGEGILNNCRCSTPCLSPSCLKNSCCQADVPALSVCKANLPIYPGDLPDALFQLDQADADPNSLTTFKPAQLKYILKGVKIITPSWFL